MRISDWSSDVCSSDLRGRSVDRAGILSAIEVLREAADHLAEVGEALFTYVLGVDRDYRRRRTAAADARARDRYLLPVLSFGFVRLRSCRRTGGLSPRFFGSGGRPFDRVGMSVDSSGKRR